jgi:hypothetical protein
MQAQLVSSHINSLKGADTMIQSAVANAIKTAKSETQSEILGEMNKKALESKLPWTKDPAIGPMAQAVMQRFLGKGLSTEDAIKNVERYYDYQDSKRGRGVNTNRSGGFNDTGEKPFQAPEGGWLKILSGQ